MIEQAEKLSAARDKIGGKPRFSKTQRAAAELGRSLVAIMDLMAEEKRWSALGTILGGTEKRRVDERMDLYRAMDGLGWTLDGTPFDSEFKACLAKDSSRRAAISEGLKLRVRSTPGAEKAEARHMSSPDLKSGRMTTIGERAANSVGFKETSNL